MADDFPLYEKACNVAVRAARKAGKMIRSAAGTIDPESIREKGIHDLVTHVDLEAERIILRDIRDEFPRHGFLAEEDTDAGQDTPADPEYLWIIDPLDGTTNFTRDVPPYAVSIALQHEENLVLGVVLDIPGDDLYTAISGQGVFVNGKIAGVSKTIRLADGLVGTGFPYRSFDHIDLYLSVLRRFMQTTRGVRRPGSAAVDLAWVATGRFDGFFETGLKPWDVAAGFVLVREGGGRVSDYSGNLNPILGEQIIASNGLVHEEMLDIVSPMRDVYD